MLGLQGRAGGRETRKPGRVCSPDRGIKLNSEIPDNAAFPSGNPKNQSAQQVP